MSQTIEIKDDVFVLLKENAVEAGVTPEVWVELKVKADSNGKRKKVSEKKKREAWANFIGASARIPEPTKKRKRSEFGEILARKFRKMGLKIDYDTEF